ncbi:hypothetical protein ACFLWC_00460 [Chloroflexota bacterium]
MVRLLKQFLSGQNGQALAIVLGLLAIGGLTIAVSLNYATTSLKGSRIVEEKTEGVYAAGAGIEYAVWALTTGEWLIDDGDTLTTQLSENISGMTVDIETENKGTFTFYLGELVYHEPPQVNIDWLEVSGDITDLGGGVYQYTVTVTLTEEADAQSIRLDAVGARLPVGYSYQALSADIEGNLSRDEPTTNTPDVHGAYMVNWVFSDEPQLKLPPPEDDIPTRTQIFRITGTGSTSGHYACAEGEPESVGQVGEIQGSLYSITATATRPEDGKTTAEIVADVIIRDDGTINIASWQITN